MAPNLSQYHLYKCENVFHFNGTHISVVIGNIVSLLGSNYFYLCLMSVTIYCRIENYQGLPLGGPFDEHIFLVSIKR